MNWLRRLGLLTLVAALVMFFGATGAPAATVSEVVEDAAATGFHLDDNVSITEEDATQIVSAARNNGSRFYLIVLADTPPGGNTTFAELILDDLSVASGTVFVLSPDDVGWVSDNEGFTENELDAAYQYANDRGGSDADYAANFVTGLSGAAASSGGGSGLIWFLVIIVAIGLLLFWLARRAKKQTVNAQAEQMAKARAAIQKQVDAIANDILDMEDEVRVANNTEVDQYYNQASETYQVLGDRLRQADSPQDLLEISNDLDVAIWQLDCAEAVLDGKPKPPKPEPKRLEPTEPVSSERVTIPAPRPDYQRRPSRRSSFMEPGMMEILVGVAGQVLAGGARRRMGASSGGGFGGFFGSRSSSQRSTPRQSGGGRVRGGGKRRR